MPSFEFLLVREKVGEGGAMQSMQASVFGSHRQAGSAASQASHASEASEPIGAGIATQD